MPPLCSPKLLLRVLPATVTLFFIFASGNLLKRKQKYLAGLIYLWCLTDKKYYYIASYVLIIPLSLVNPCVHVSGNIPFQRGISCALMKQYLFFGSLPHSSVLSYLICKYSPKKKRFAYSQNNLSRALGNLLSDIVFSMCYRFGIFIDFSKEMDIIECINDK